MTRGLKGSLSNFCSKCKAQKENPKKRYCKLCSNEYMRNYRKTHIKVFNDLEKLKRTARWLLNVKIQRGKIKKLPCEICGNLKVEGHHEDYNKPYDVNWLCIKHHKERHKEMEDNEKITSNSGMVIQDQNLQSKLLRSSWRAV